jgi:uncharacterized protein YecE (DUF72 family)
MRHLQLEALRPLAEAGKLGCLLFQFPHWFRKNRANVDYLRELRDRVPADRRRVPRWRLDGGGPAEPHAEAAGGPRLR